MAKQLQAAGRIREVMNIQNFINLPGKEVEDSTEDLIEHVVKLYAGPNRDAETDEEDTQQPQIKLNEALEALRTLRLYEEQQEDGDREVIVTLLRHDRRIQGRRLQNTKQVAITTFFSRASHPITASRTQIRNTIL